MADQPRSRKVFDLGQGLELWKCHLDDLDEQDKNARAMDPETFARLSQTIAKQSRLEQLPLAALVPGKDGKPPRLKIISGHHRTRAARAAGVFEVYALVDVSGLTHSQIVAKQLAHNSIFGVDDQDILAELFAEMDDLADMLESHIDPRALSTAIPMDAESTTDVGVDFRVRTVVLTFLPSTSDDFEFTADVLNTLDPEAVELLPADLYEKFTAACRAIGTRFEIRQNGAMVAKMLDIVTDWLAANVATPEGGEAKPPKRESKDARKAREAKEKAAAKLAARRPAANALDAFRKAKEKAGVKDEPVTP